MRRVQQIMGMPIVVDITTCKYEQTFNDVFKLLNCIDKQFSPYKERSELSRFNRGEIKPAELSTKMKEIIAACRSAQKDTGGYFSAWYKREFDPSGYVKGWAIKQAGKLIENSGYKTFCIYGGGDILAASGGKKVWRIGIQDPKDKRKMLNMLSISNGAVATSGNYERGHHIINPKTGKPARDLKSLTVIGPDIVKADVLATAGFAMGRKGIKFINSHPGYSAYAVPSSGR